MRLTAEHITLRTGTGVPTVCTSPASRPTPVRSVMGCRSLSGSPRGGLVRFVSGASGFLTARAMGQIKVDLAYSKRLVALCAQSPGVGYGELGPTHHSIEDLAWLRAIDGMTIVVPADPVETASAIRWAATHDGPAVIRISRNPVPAIHDESYEFVPDRSVTSRRSRSACAS